MKNVSPKIQFHMIVCLQKMLKTLRRTKAYKTMPQAAHYPVKKTPMLPEGCFDGKVAFSKFEKFYLLNRNFILNNTFSKNSQQ